MLSLLLMGMLTLAFNIQLAEAKPTTITVPDDHPTIQEAINAANLGDTIYVRTGTYSENVVVNKTVTLIGENRDATIIDGRNAGTVVNIASDNVIICNFTILDSSMEYRFFGVAISYQNNVTIEDSNIRNNNIGIMLRNSKDIKVERNIVSNNYGGIIVNYSQNITVTENYVSNNSWGISLYASRECELENNVMVDNRYNLGVNGKSLADFAQSISSSNTVNGKLVYYLHHLSNVDINPTTYPNLGYLAVINSTEIAIHDLNITQNLSGILLVNTNNSKISNVYATRNYGGIVVYLSSGITIEANTIFKNVESGIYVGYSANSKMLLNTVTNHTRQQWSNGIELYYSEKITVSENNLLNNKYGMFLYYSDENSIYWNNFDENTYQVGIYASYNNAWDKGYPSGGNFWSDYVGVDFYSGPYQNLTGRDGIGDTPYTIDVDNQDRYPLMKPFAPLTGDLNEDRQVNIRDIALAARAFGSYLEHPRWNPKADINNDNSIDIRDLSLIARNYGKTYP